MRIRLCTAVVCLAACAEFVAGVVATAQNPPPRVASILVGPNILASRDGNVPHVELLIAAHPRDSHVLLGAGIVVGDLVTQNAAYVSRDGGTSWTSYVFPQRDVVDPVVAFGPTGTAFFANLGARLLVFRSENNGDAWSPPIELGRDFDHPQMVADHSAGLFRGRVYLTVLADGNSRVKLFRSEDDGRTWNGPVEFDNGHGEVGLNVSTPLVLSDGALFMPYFRYEVKPEKRSPNSWHQDALFVTSTDGGVTFSSPSTISTEMYGPKLMSGKTSFAVRGRSQRTSSRSHLPSLA